MRFRLLLPIAALSLLTQGLAARPKRDVLYFKNGDRMTCEIKRLSTLKLTVSVDYIDGSIPVDWSLISRIESDQPFIVELLSGDILTGLVQTAASAKSDSPIVVVDDGAGSRQVETLDIATIRQDENRWYERLHGSADISWIYARANDQTQLASNANITYTAPRWDASAETHSNLSSVAGVESANRTQNRLQAARYFGARWLAAGFGDFLKSAEQNLDLRATTGAAIGKDLLRGHRTRLRVMGGLVRTQERYSEASGGARRNSLEGAILGEYSFFTFKNANFYATGYLYPSISKPGRLRVDTGLSSRVKIFKDVTITFAFYSNYDNDPPEGGRRADYGANTGIGYTF
jgi:hypothetical protein